jgi:type II secretory pathway pseudopilin PulG
VVCIAIVGGMFLAAMSGLAAATAAREVNAARLQAHALAMDLMSEILQSSYKEPTDTAAFGLEAGESPASRANWDDVDDFAGFSQSPPTRRDGTVIPATAGWRWEASVTYADPSDPSKATAVESGLKRITVTVTDPRGRRTTLDALRCSAGVYDLNPTALKTYVSRVEVQLQIGPDARSSLTSGVNLLNEPN